MAIVRVQGKANNGFANAGGTVALSFDALPAAGNMVSVIVGGWQTNILFAAGGCVDNQGNTYTRVDVAGAGSEAVAIYHCLSIGSPSGTFTVTVTGGGTGTLYGWAAIIEHSGVGGYEGTAKASGSSTAPSVTRSVATASGLALAGTIVGVGLTSLTVESLSPAWTQEAECLNASAYMPGEGDTRITTIGVGNFTAAWVCAPTGNWSAMVATYTAAVASGQFARPASDIASGAFRSIHSFAPFGSRVLA